MQALLLYWFYRWGAGSTEMSRHQYQATQETYVVSFWGPSSWPLLSAASQSVLSLMRVATTDCFKESGGYALSFENGVGLGHEEAEKMEQETGGATEESTRAESRLTNQERVEDKAWETARVWSGDGCLISLSFGIRTNWVKILILPLSGWKTLSTLLNFSEPHFLHF